MEKRISKQQIMAIAGASLLQCALIGILVNTSGTLFSPIALEYDFAMTRVSAFNILKSIAGAVTGAALTSMMFRSEPRKFMMASVGMIAAGYVLVAIGADTPLWYAAPVLVSLSSTIGIVAVPFVLSQRLPRGAGSATGFAMAFSGVGGVLFNPAAAFLIEKVGWRATIWILCLITVLFAAAGVLLIFGFSRHEITGVPPEAKEKPASGIDRSPKMRRRFLLCCLCLLGGSFCTPFVPFVNIYAERIGYSAIIGATLASAVMAGNIVGKLLFGVLCDVVGTWKAMLAGAVCVFAGLVGFIVFQKILPLLYISAFLFGISYALATIALSKCALAAYGAEQSRHYSGIHTSIICALSAIASLGIGAIYDWTNSFVPMLVIMAASVLVSIVAVFAIKADAEKDRAAGGPGE